MGLNVIIVHGSMSGKSRKSGKSGKSGKVGVSTDKLVTVDTGVLRSTHHKRELFIIR